MKQPGSTCIIEYQCPKCDTSIEFFSINTDTKCPVCRSIFQLVLEMVQDGEDEMEEMEELGK